MESCNTESSLDLPLESLSLHPFLQSLHKEQWQEVRLGEVAEIISGGTPKTSIPEYWNGEIPWLSVADFNNGKKYVIASEKFITQLGLQESSTKLLQRDDIIISARGTVGVIAMIPYPMAFNQSCYGLRICGNAHSHFIYYCLKVFTKYFIHQSYGAVFDTITTKILSDFTFLLPPLTIQQKIAEILSSFDDKIDLLHRQNKTLESLALTLFRHYFIDNPNRSEWELGKLGDYVKIIDNRGKTPPFTTDITPYPLIEVNALSDDSMLINYDIVRKYVIKETYQNWFREHIKQYDILLSTVGSIGEVAMLLDNKGCIAQNVIGFRARDISPFYLYEWLKYMQQEIKEFDIGSVQPSIKITHFVEKQIYKPDSKTLESFDKQMLLMTNKISHNAKQIQNLQAMRDMLLKAIFA
ncbi:MAG: restriction endonuclease subunit S [Helicobacter sp.]|uniref:restriction endonuclease subunit S n=1 Tax=Helicobacter sp. TaxID=218 RepID=UPI002A90E6BC|nr:restriction endonuclease subunit S [Helicobacter sp.]MDY5821328.1 restriction endonuclease subunit S [Helicobacter sp.]